MYLAVWITLFKNPIWFSRFSLGMPCRLVLILLGSIPLWSARHCLVVSSCEREVSVINESLMRGNDMNNSGTENSSVSLQLVVFFWRLRCSKLSRGTESTEVIFMELLFWGTFSSLLLRCCRTDKTLPCGKITLDRFDFTLIPMLMGMLLAIILSKPWSDLAKMDLHNQRKWHERRPLTPISSSQEEIFPSWVSKSIAAEMKNHVKHQSEP